MLKAYTYKILNSSPTFCRRCGASLVVICLLGFISSPAVFAQHRTRVLQTPTAFTTVPPELLLRIVRAEDERRWDDDVRTLLRARSAVVRKRAALAAGRIGKEESLADLINLLRSDDELEVRAMAAFALGEIESPSTLHALLGLIGTAKDPLLRARITEALGKIAAALPKDQEALARQVGDGILEVLRLEADRPSAPDRLTVLLGLTAALRAKTSNGGPTIARFLSNSDPRIRADAANTLARLRLKDGNEQLRTLLKSDPDPVVRANAARVMGATTDREAFDALVELATKDPDSRVRVSAVRALASLKDREPRVAKALASLWCERKLLQNRNMLYHERDDECIELVTALGRAFQGTGDEEILGRFSHWSSDFRGAPPELDIAQVRIAPATYLSKLGEEGAAKRKVQEAMLTDWQEASRLAQGLGAVAALPEATKDRKQLGAKAETLLRAMLDYRNSGSNINTLVAVHSEYAVPDVLRALAAFKPQDLGEVGRKHLMESDIVIRATAAELLGELPPDEVNTRLLIEALPLALRDQALNDAALAILDSLAKQKSGAANNAIKTALDSSDHLIRRKAVALLKANGGGDFSSRIGTVQTRNTKADYERALKRMGKNLSATVTTSKGAF
ncbi:MAG TPA: HEAT repeat domain-containing protein, partial [Pyrinomonadaceae bacterium]|nr:HEAT repeat domain-containing protein [Pyrinomonadaceae bacterium]